MANRPRREKREIHIVRIAYLVLGILSFYKSYSLYEAKSISLSLIFLYIGVALIFLTIRSFKSKPEYEERADNFIKEVLAETMPPHGKVSWPNKKIILGSTLVVFVACAILTLYLGVVDFVFLKLINFIVGR